MTRATNKAQHSFPPIAISACEPKMPFGQPMEMVAISAHELAELRSDRAMLDRIRRAEPGQRLIEQLVRASNDSLGCIDEIYEDIGPGDEFDPPADAIDCAYGQCQATIDCAHGCNGTGMIDRVYRAWCEECQGLGLIGPHDCGECDGRGWHYVDHADYGDGLAIAHSNCAEIPCGRDKCPETKRELPAPDSKDAAHQKAWHALGEHLQTRDPDLLPRLTKALQDFGFARLDTTP